MDAKEVIGMPTVELTDAQCRQVLEVLDDCLSDLRMEISHTDNSEFRATLKTRKALLQSVVSSLSAPVDA